MLPLTNSPFLQALGYAIINSLWQFALLWLIYVLVSTVLKLSSHQKYVAGLFLQVGGFIWFVATFNFNYDQELQFEVISLPLQISPSLYSSAQNAVTAPGKLLAGIMQSEKLRFYLSVTYLFLLTFSCLRWIKGYHITQSMRMKGLYKTEVNWILFVKKLAAQLGIKQEVKIYMSALTKTPLTIGFFKPIILIPLASLNQLSTDQMEAVILHELAHIKRYDYLFNLFLASIETVLFFNPFTILISRHIKRERENCCDDWVLLYNYNAASYAAALLQIATSQSAGYSLALKAADNKQVLLNRIKRMIEKREMVFFNYKYQAVALFVMVSVLSSLALLSSRTEINKNILSANAMNFNLIPNSIKYSIYPAATIDTAAQKMRLSKDHLVYNNSVKSLNYTALPRVTTEKNKKPKINQQQLNELILPAEVIPAIAENNYNDLPADRSEKKVEISDARSDQMISTIKVYNEQEFAIAMEKFEKVALKLLKNQKSSFDKNQYLEKTKSVLKQMQAVKSQLAVAKKAIEASKKEENAIATYQIANIIQQTSFNAAKIEFAQNELKEAEINVLKLTSGLDINIMNHEMKLPQVIFNLPLQPAAHSFSFEFAEKPHVKSFSPHLSSEHQKVKSMNKVYIEDGKNFTNKFMSPSVPAELRPKVKQENKNLYIIRI